MVHDGIEELREADVSPAETALADQKTNGSYPITTKQKLILVACSCSSCFMHMGVSTIPLLLPPEVRCFLQSIKEIFSKFAAA